MLEIIKTIYHKNVCWTMHLDKRRYFTHIQLGEKRVRVKEKL